MLRVRSALRCSWLPFWQSQASCFVLFPVFAPSYPKLPTTYLKHKHENSNEHLFISYKVFITTLRCLFNFRIWLNNKLFMLDHVFKCPVSVVRLQSYMMSVTNSHFSFVFPDHLKNLPICRSCICSAVPALDNWHHYD